MPLSSNTSHFFICSWLNHGYTHTIAFLYKIQWFGRHSVMFWMNPLPPSSGWHCCNLLSCHLNSTSFMLHLICTFLICYNYDIFKQHTIFNFTTVYCIMCGEELQHLSPSSFTYMVQNYKSSLRQSYQNTLKSNWAEQYKVATVNHLLDRQIFISKKCSD